MDGLRGAECAILVVVETVVILLVENEDDTLVAKVGHLSVGNAIGGFHAFSILCDIVQSIDGLEGLPHTGIVHVVEDGVGVLRGTAALEVHATDILAALYPCSGEVGELRVEVVVGTVAETALGGTVVVVLGSHQNFAKSFVLAVNTSPAGIEVPVVGCQRAGSDNLVAKGDDTGQVLLLVVTAVPFAATLALPEEQGLGEEVGGGIACPCAVAAPFVFWKHLVGLLKVADYLIEGLLFGSTLVVFPHITVGRSGLQHHAAILGEQAVVVIAAEEVGLAKGFVAGVFVLHVHGFLYHQVGGGDTIVHFIPESRHGRAVLVGSTQGSGQVEWVEAWVIGVPALRGEVGTIGELICSIEGNAVSPFVSEMPTDVSVESGSHLQGTRLIIQQCVGHLVPGILIQEVVATRCDANQGKHRQCTANQ